MPILFKGKSTHYHGSSHAHLPHSPSNLRMGDDATGGMSVSGSGSRLPHAHSTTSSSGGGDFFVCHCGEQFSFLNKQFFRKIFFVQKDFYNPFCSIAITSSSQLVATSGRVDFL